MKIGAFGMRADSRGLAYQGQAYAKHLNPTRVFGIDMTTDHLSPYKNDWSPYAHTNLTVRIHSEIEEHEVRKWLRGLDVVIGAETFYRDDFPIWAREEGIRTVLAPNPEFYAPPKYNLPQPDLLIAPTTWRIRDLPNAIHLPFPVDREEFPFRLRTKAQRFVHVAGHRAVADRAGTRIVLGNLRRLIDHDIIIRSQSPLGFDSPILRNRLEQVNVAHPRELYHDADVVLLPRRYGGNNLVANEALSSGIPVIALDREPENQWGGVMCVPGMERGHIKTKAGMIPLHNVKDGVFQNAVRKLAECPEEVERLSVAADRYAHLISWDTLLSRYMDVLRG